MTTAYYKTNDPAVLAAWTQCIAETEALLNDVKAFAARFGAEGKVFHNPTRFAGLVFPKRERPSSLLWCAPDYNGMQRPRAKAKSTSTPAQRVQHAALLEAWEARPLAQVSDDPVFRALGRTAGDFVFGGLNMFIRGGWLYAATGAAMPTMTEILASEYKAAKEGAVWTGKP